MSFASQPPRSAPHDPYGGLPSLAAAAGPPDDDGAFRVPDFIVGTEMGYVVGT